MRALAMLLMAVLVAGCGPSSGLSSAHAGEALPRLHPQVIEGDADGQVFEYH